MERILFVDACMRGPGQSRTYRLCRRFLDRYAALHPGTELLHRDLSSEPPALMTSEQARLRDSLVSGQPDHPLLAPAREVAAADLILVGAPYWDLSFPAVLKAYLEWTSVLGITFRYEEDGRQVGMSRARHLVYLTAAGGPVDGQNYGYDYIRALAHMFGIPKTHCVAAEGLDIRGADLEAILGRAEARVDALVPLL